MRKKIKVMLMLAAAACMILGNTLSVSAAPADKFTDVSPEASYYAAVNWAVEQGVISGTSQTTFSPNKPCTRYQYAVMLYKLAGKPAVEGENPFTDVTETASYYKAVTWAYNQGIISGTTKTTFSPDASVTRYQVVAMLYKMIGRPAVDSAENPFADVSSEASYYKAVMWAVQNKITSGTSATTFSPDAECLRYQMVVFLKKFWPIYTASTNKIVVLDPGHSAVFAGAGYAGYEEHIVNLKVALACKEYLEEHYTGITVYLTREDHSPVDGSNLKADLKKRVQIAKNYNADALVSMHFNATNSHAASGCLAFVSFQPNISAASDALADSILSEISKMGIQNLGKFKTLSNEYFDKNGAPLDYYAINRHSAACDLPGIIIEHCFMDTQPQYLTDKNLAKFGKADAIGIANYFGLTEKAGK